MRAISVVFDTGTVSVEQKGRTGRSISSSSAKPEEIRMSLQIMIRLVLVVLSLSAMPLLVSGWALTLVSMRCVVALENFGTQVGVVRMPSQVVRVLIAVLFLVPAIAMWTVGTSIWEGFGHVTEQVLSPRND